VLKIQAERGSNAETRITKQVMKLDLIMQDIEYEILQECNFNATEIGDIVIDSRKATKNSLFVCLRGAQVDGHEFIADVAAKGAAAVIVDNIDRAENTSANTNKHAYPSGITVLHVNNARRALCVISANFNNRPAKKLRLFGVTGTNGKTSVTYMIENILRQITPTGLIGTIGLHINGNPINIPFTTSTTPDPQELHQILDYILQNGGKDVVMEVSSHALKLHKVDGLFFEVAVFTNLTQDHMDFHRTMDNYLACKVRLFTRSKCGVVNVDDKYSKQIIERGTCEKWLTYGINTPCDVRAVNIVDSDEGSEFSVQIGETLEQFFMPTKGLFNIYNALAAIATATAIGTDLSKIKSGIASFGGVPGRIQIVPNNRGLRVLVDYAHSPDGLVNIINAVRAFTDGKVITLFGCGGDRDAEKRPIMGRIAGELSDHCIITSDNPRTEQPDKIIAAIQDGVTETNCPFDTFVDRRTAIFHGISILQPGDSLIIAGKGHENYQLIGKDTLPFDDFEIAKSAMAG